MSFRLHVWFSISLLAFVRFSECPEWSAGTNVRSLEPSHVDHATAFAVNAALAGESYDNLSAAIIFK